MAESAFRSQQLAPTSVDFIQTVKTGGPVAKPDPQHVSLCLKGAFLKLKHFHEVGISEKLKTQATAS